jgi:hypothetical protein
VLDLENADSEELDRLSAQYAALAEKARGRARTSERIPEPS